jgi:hypothetical protein
LSREIPAIYPVNRVQIEYISVKANDKELIKEELFHGRVPQYLLMAMVPKAAFYGDYTKNPFNFKPFNLSSLSLKKDREIFPYEAFKPDFKNSKCQREYISLFQSNGLFGKDAQLTISYEEFLNGYTHFQWNLTSNARGTNSIPDERANLTLSADFTDPLAEAVVMILYGVFDGAVYIYGNEQIVTDYQS